MILYLVVWCVGSLPLGIVVGKALKARGGASPRLPATRPVSGADLPHPSVTVGPTFLAGASTREGEVWAAALPTAECPLSTPAAYVRVYSPGTPMADALINSIPKFKLMEDDA